MAKSQPILAVIMATHNDNELLARCVESLNSSTVPFELFIVDDASKQPATNFITPAKHIHITRTERNIGPAKARNIAIQQALKGPFQFIAIMDADDTVHPQRFEKQLDFFGKNKDVAVVGTWANVVSETDERTLFHLNYPQDHAAICKALCYNSCFVHPSAMFRAEAMHVLKGYDETFPVAQDYEIFVRASRLFQLANIPEYLVNYTWSSKSITGTKRKKQILARLRIQRMYLNTASPHAWLGLLKTVLTVLVPKKVIDTIKVLNDYKRKLCS